MIGKARLVVAPLALLVAIGAAEGQSGNGYTLRRSTIAAGGTSTGDGYKLNAAIGQHDAGTVWGDIRKS